MFELIVLGVVLAGLTAIARWPGPKHHTENLTPSVPGPWAPQSDWRRFDRPTYLRRGIVLGVRATESNPSGKRSSPMR